MNNLGRECGVSYRERPTQAVILAGGRGTRLRPLTDCCPKPMVEICGKPFLEYQVEQLREQGFERILLLLGYLPEVVQDYFGDGRRWGVRIEYSVTAVDDETGRRVKIAAPYLADLFLLMYCDNYWPMQMERMWERFRASRAAAMITVYSNKDGYTQNSVRVETDGMVSIYDKSCSHPDLNGVEISYAILNKSVLQLLGGDNVLFETAVYPVLAEQKRLAGYVTDHRYYSIGSHRRLPLTGQFFRGQKTVILDRDGVLNRRPPRAQYVRCWSEFEWLPGAQKALRRLHERGYRVIVVSNQAGVARGVMSREDVDRIHDQMKREAAAFGGRIDAVYYCVHDWDAGCDCRKPRPGMLFQAQKDFHLNLSRTAFIGDDERDSEAAAAAGCPFIAVSETRPLYRILEELFNFDLSEGNERHETTTGIDHRA